MSSALEIFTKGAEMNIPEWCDENLSKDLPVFRSRGESQELEFMEVFPQNLRELAKEIAAFATSNSGTVIIGVSNSGDLSGLPECISPEGRDAILRRLEGVCHGTIKPSITPTAKFAIEDSKIVLVISVSKGSQPIYFTNNIPYLRHFTEARPAEPHEVIDLIKNWLGQFGEKPIDLADPKEELLLQIFPKIIGIQIYLDEKQERRVNPWLDQWRGYFKETALEMNDLSVSEVAVKCEISKDLKAIAKKLEEFATYRWHLNCGAEIQRILTETEALVDNFRTKHLGQIKLGEADTKKIKEVFETSKRKISDLVEDISTSVQRGKIGEIQSSVTQIGQTLLILSHYLLIDRKEDVGEKLKRLGQRLHLLETRRIQMDGGRSVNLIIDEIKSLNNDFENISL